MSSKNISLPCLLCRKSVPLSAGGGHQQYEEHLRDNHGVWSNRDWIVYQTLQKQGGEKCPNNLVTENANTSIKFPAMAYMLENEGAAHTAAVLESLQGWGKEQPDLHLVSAQGAVLITHRIFFKLYSRLVTSVLQDFSPDTVPSIFVPASTDSLVYLIKVLSTGFSMAAKKDDLLDVLKAAELMGISLKGVQIGTKKRQKTKPLMKEIKTVVGEKSKVVVKNEKHASKKVMTDVNPLNGFLPPNVKQEKEELSVAEENDVAEPIKTDSLSNKVVSSVSSRYILHGKDIITRNLKSLQENAIARSEIMPELDMVIGTIEEGSTCKDESSEVFGETDDNKVN